MRLQYFGACFGSMAILLTACGSDDHRLGSGAQAVGGSGSGGTSSGSGGTSSGSGGTSSGTGGTGGDPCKDVNLPECPAECAPNAFQNCGQPCGNEGEACGNSIGDGMKCVAGTWACSVHPPLGSGCNLVCRPKTDPCAGKTFPACPAECPSDYSQHCGQACSSEGAECGNEIGDGMKCVAGTWACGVHPPLGTGCNLLCRRDGKDACDGQPLPTCPEECAPNASQNCGQSCANEGQECGNSIGDGMKCVGGSWKCATHPPLGPDCNAICRDLPS